MMSINRRQFERLRISGDAYAVDANGRELGKVSHAGGGGMLITTKSPEEAQSMRPGERIAVTIMEPKTQTANSIDVIVRYLHGAQVGVEFITGTAIKQG
jgi:hypothetical protein